jgi:leader peptidase (prepilin peptidase)/N-methyltransferase
VIAAFALLFGLVAGSFVTAAAQRLAEGRSLTARSRCDACLRPLGLRDLIPVVSYVAARGACRFCGAAIGARSTLVEAALGGAFVACAFVFPPAVAIAACALCAAGALALLRATAPRATA